MKSPILYIILLFLFACSDNSEKVNTETVTKIRPVLTEKKAVKKIDTMDLCNDRYLIISTGHKIQSVISLAGDTILKAKDYYSHLIVEDFDKDGCDDLVFENTPRYCGIFEVFLYNDERKKVYQVKNILPNQWKLEGTDHYISFERLKDSCYKWKSYLSKIEKLNNVATAVIYSKKCDGKEHIELYTVDKGKEIFESELPISEFRKHSSPQEFLKNYWWADLKKAI